jgi:hypothetical protein
VRIYRGRPISRFDTSHGEITDHVDSFANCRYAAHIAIEIGIPRRRDTSRRANGRKAAACQTLNAREMAAYLAVEPGVGVAAGISVRFNRTSVPLRCR